jgi:hypothetical protein
LVVKFKCVVEVIFCLVKEFLPSKYNDGEKTFSNGEDRILFCKFKDRPVPGTLLYKLLSKFILKEGFDMTILEAC